jgi:phosphoglycolate phosphatase
VSALVVGFDLDMTLVDSAEGIVAAVGHVVATHGRSVDDAAVRETLGLPLDLVFPRFIDDVPYPVLLAEYRAYYAEHGIPTSRPLPGAVAALDAVRQVGGRILIVTAKHATQARAVLDVSGLMADDVAGESFAEQKGEVLVTYGASMYVGDHVGDIAGARLAGIAAVGVATGPTSAAELQAAGADVVFADLDEFPDWFASWLKE